MNELLRQYGKSVGTFLLTAILLCILIGGGILGVKGLISIQGDKSNNYFQKMEYQTDENGEYVTDADGNNVIISDFEYVYGENGEKVTNENGEYVTISHSNDLNNNIKTEIDSFKDLDIELKNRGNFSTGKDIECYFSDTSNTLLTGIININGVDYKLIDEKEYDKTNNSENVLPASVKINYIKAETISIGDKSETSDNCIVVPVGQTDPENLLKNNGESGSRVYRTLKSENTDNLYLNQMILAYDAQDSKHTKVVFHQKGLFYISMTINITDKSGQNGMENKGFTVTRTLPIHVM